MEGSLKRNAMMTYLFPKFRCTDKIAFQMAKFGLKLISFLTFVCNFEIVNSSTVNSTTWESRPHLVLSWYCFAYWFRCYRITFPIYLTSALHWISAASFTNTELVLELFLPAFLHEFERFPTAKRLSMKFTSNLWLDDKISSIFDCHTQTGGRFVNFSWLPSERSL